ncbi:hypothetical protein BRC83_01330 [Halobacteriales archaeon QS_1_68_17]|nr:MAG: hypothetical protein BRC83_01330 [Halobacteriales archaeon QS_1_68_17]
MATTHSATRFTTAAATLALLACPLAFVAPLLLGAPAGPRGSVALSALVGGVFAGYDLVTVRREGRPRFAAAVMAAVFGGWLILAPLQYEVGTAMTATTQFAGMVLASFSGYAALEAIEQWALGRPSARAE